MLVPSFLDLMGGDNEINWDWKLRIDEVMNLIWLDGWDANGVVWRFLKLDGLKYEVLLVINTGICWMGIRTSFVICDATYDGTTFWPV
ncbi:hypothetical protein RHMOL_Rhmol03G0040700 [Rhododendron molle]|uniref:Uncharacterized protein n=1 Tax=Rhododendron molle TaxID=49168 RepID=A0ACC0PCL5_RHOML|nr:hypothetical protein RHMOL_Rhmol03G0040700 [Rhododendron molle]